MDLLNANGRRDNEMSGITDQEDWFEHKKGNSRDPYHRGSTNAYRLANSGSNGHLETT